MSGAAGTLQFRGGAGISPGRGLGSEVAGPGSAVSGSGPLWGTRSVPNVNSDVVSIALEEPVDCVGLTVLC